MDRKRLVIPGVLTAAAAGVVAAGLALSGGAHPVDSPDNTPAGQVEELPDPTVPASPSSTVPATPSTVVVPPAAPLEDDAPVNDSNEPAPVEEVPPPGVPYDSDGATVMPNPPNMAPGEVAPRPPSQGSVEPPAPPVAPPVPPNEDADPNAGQV